MRVIPVKWKALIFPLVDGLSFKSASAHVPDVLLFSSLVHPPRVPKTSSALHPRGVLHPALTDPARWSGGVVLRTRAPTHGTVGVRRGGCGESKGLYLLLAGKKSPPPETPPPSPPSIDIFGFNHSRSVEVCTCRSYIKQPKRHCY